MAGDEFLQLSKLDAANLGAVFRLPPSALRVVNVAVDAVKELVQFGEEFFC